MNQPKAFGTFTKRGSHSFRTSAYIQWGISIKSIGAALLLNPGSANFDKLSSELTTALHTLGNVEGEIYTDPTMKLLIKIIEGIYAAEHLDGRFQIYNLFNLQNTDNKHAIDQFESLVESGEYDIMESLVTHNELITHPWIYLGWGVEQKSKWKSIGLVKESWLNLISNSGVPTFGKKHSKTNDYYHPSYAIYRPTMINELINLYNQKFKIKKQRFSQYATKPNLLIDHTPVEQWVESDFGWFISPSNPETIVSGFSHLHIKEGYKLRAYQYTHGANGNGIVWAIPEDTELPDPNECTQVNEHIISTPKPVFALDDFMQIIDGDKSPMSYLQASIIFHDLHEFGAVWHGTQWGQDVILPLNEDYSLGNHDWEMIEDIPEVIEPHFYYCDEGNPTVVFHTINDIGTVTMNRYVHTFSKSDYTLKFERFIIATAGGEIIF
ncbi:hypothetical protein HZF08_01810 [Paenibacillus sp. CGMCC 1.16610]|uniref:Uncharacterized protein n=1 Tax=Paenibacillus anseongense TaxID=2682845 RepID=A0ABW9U6C9_9BACL|nr:MULTISPECIES: hypothetical protein [Paenibacillus]MBA2937036.1 hypothetical protein [Paenibacillus sp. CGMCC 1.16610]MVQ33360.1 hypothetical protein [Paenibacillus anseongense]